MPEALKPDDLERMLVENFRAREQIAELLRVQIELREQELPRLQAMLASIEACGVPGVEVRPPPMVEESVKLIRGETDDFLVVVHPPDDSWTFHALTELASRLSGRSARVHPGGMVWGAGKTDVYRIGREP